jgi:ubiquitin carboxyl-terminal hydrolase 8
MVDCPLTKLDLTKYVPPTSAKSSITDPNGKPLGHVYNLYAVSNHYGTLNGGHYTASVRNGYNGEWRYFDDSQISLINEKKVVVSYSIVYK